MIAGKSVFRSNHSCQWEDARGGNMRSDVKNYLLRKTVRKSKVES